MFLGLTIAPISSHWVCSSKMMCDWIVGKCFRSSWYWMGCSFVVMREPNRAAEPWNCQAIVISEQEVTEAIQITIPESSRFWLANNRVQETPPNTWHYCKMFPANTMSVRHKGWFMTSGNSCLLLKDNEISHYVKYSLLTCLPAIHKSLADIWGWDFLTLSGKSSHD